MPVLSGMLVLVSQDRSPRLAGGVRGIVGAGIDKSVAGAGSIGIGYEHHLSAIATTEVACIHPLGCSALNYHDHSHGHPPKTKSSI